MAQAPEKIRQGVKNGSASVASAPALAKSAAAPEPDETTAATFHRLAETWRAETGHFSFVAKMIEHPAYQAIIELGPAVVPLMLRELQQEPDYWFSALRSLTGADPTRPGNNFDGATAAWLQWGQEQGYLE